MERETVLVGVVIMKENWVALVHGRVQIRAAYVYFWNLQNVLKLFVKPFLYSICQLVFLVISTTHLLSLSYDSALF